MGDLKEEGRPDERPPGAARPEPPYQALFPNLDRISRSSFEKGTLSRRRINRALVVLAVIPLIVVAILLIPILAPR